MKTVTVRTLEETDVFAHEIARGLVKQDTAIVIALHGNLGAGKTTFTQCFARALGVSETVTSPTFVVMKRYALEQQQCTVLTHIDAYRIEDEQELEVLGIRDLLADSANLVLIEWAERVPTFIPNGALSISMTPNEDGSRTITYENYEREN